MTAPYAMVTVTGGTRTSGMVDLFYVDLDCWASTQAAAIAACGELMADAIALEGQATEHATFGGVRVETLPYGNPDPDRPRLARATCALQVTAHVAE